MRHITGIKKYFFLLKALNREFLTLPLGFILFLIKQMRFEKFTIHADKIFINSIYTPFPSGSYRTALKCFKRLSERKISPFSVYISLTDKCHLDCWHCSNFKDGEKHELSYEGLKRIMHEIQDAGASCIGLTGGEPALRVDLEKLVNQIDERSYSILFTTGHSISLERARALQSAGLTIIVISLDSHIKEEHNSKRNSEIAFDEAISAIRNSLEAGIYTAISTVITKKLLYSPKLYDFFEYVGALGVHEIRLLEPKPCGKLLNYEFDYLDEEDKKKIREVQYSINTKGKLPTIMALSHINSVDNYGCNAGRTHVYINARGDMCPCDFSPLSFGNLVEESFSDVYTKMNRAFPKPSGACIISSLSNHLKDIGPLPVTDRDKIDGLLGKINRGSVPKLFSKLGFRAE